MRGTTPSAPGICGDRSRKLPLCPATMGTVSFVPWRSLPHLLSEGHRGRATKPRGPCFDRGSHASQRAGDPAGPRVPRALSREPSFRKESPWGPHPQTDSPEPQEPASPPTLWWPRSGGLGVSPTGGGRARRWGEGRLTGTWMPAPGDARVLPARLPRARAALSRDRAPLGADTAWKATPGCPRGPRRSRLSRQKWGGDESRDPACPRTPPCPPANPPPPWDCPCASKLPGPRSLAGRGDPRGPMGASLGARTGARSGAEAAQVTPWRRGPPVPWHVSSPALRKRGGKSPMHLAWSRVATTEHARPPGCR